MLGYLRSAILETDWLIVGLVSSLLTVYIAYVPFSVQPVLGYSCENCMSFLHAAELQFLYR